MREMISKQTLGQTKKLIKELEKADDSTLFHTYDWLRIIEKTLELETQVYVFNNKTHVAFVPCYPRKSGITILFSPAFRAEMAYGGFVGKGNKERMYQALKNEAENFVFVLPEKLDLKGMTCEPKYTIITKLDAKNAEEHYKRLKKGHRYNIRKAKKDDLLELKEEYTESAIKKYYELLKSTYGYKGYKPLPYKFYKEIITHYHKKKQIKLLLAYKGKKPIGTICAIRHKDRLHYWTGGFLRNPEYRKLYPNDVLQWEIIKWGYSIKIKTYDMLGADMEGIRRFKLGFGGELTELTRIYSNRKLKLLSQAYGKAAPMIRKLLN